jgi:adenylate cyclase
MAQEIERKFLVADDTWRDGAERSLYKQGYIPTQGEHTVRVRLVGDNGYLTLKGPAIGLVRSEFEYSIPRRDAEAMLQEFCSPPLIEKYRYRLMIGDVVWEVDEFLGENQGLILAEVELEDPTQPIELPSWIGQEVTGDPRYFNSKLALNPYTQWDKDPQNACN